MNDDQFGDPISGEWPMPVSRPRVPSLLDVLRDWARRVKEWAIGWQEDDE